MTDEEIAIEMFVGGLVLDPNTQAPVVILKDESGKINLPIWIGVTEATSIASAIKEIQMARPLTHDLMSAIFGELNVRVQRVVITELKESTYYAELILSAGEKALILDSRPSDAIALALRASAPIFVTKQVLQQAQMTINAASAECSETGEGSASEQEEPMQSHQDFKNIDKKKWAEILEELEADDFKYKV